MDDDTNDVAQQARARTAEVAGTAKDQASGVLESASDQVQAITREAQDHLHELMSNARDELRSQADQRAREAAVTLRQMSQELRTMAGSIDGDSTLRALTRQASESTGGLAARLEAGGIDRVSRDLAAKARRRPGMFLLGSLAAGVVVGRIVRDVAPIAGSPDDRWSDDPRMLASNVASPAGASATTPSTPMQGEFGQTATAPTVGTSPGGLA